MTNILGASEAGLNPSWEQRDELARSFARKHFPDADTERWGSYDYGYRLYGKIGNRDVWIATQDGRRHKTADEIVAEINASLASPL